MTLSISSDLLEKNLRRALILSDGDISPFFTRPISAVVATLIFGTIAWKIWDLRNKKIAKEAS
jgi:putative tricarboxylic transport membrane protein